MSIKKEYRSSARSRRLIRQAFLELIEEKTVDKITVTDVPSRHIPAMATEYVSVQLLGFDLFGSLTHIFSLHDFCSSGQ